MGKRSLTKSTAKKKAMAKKAATKKAAPKSAKASAAKKPAAKKAAAKKVAAKKTVAKKRVAKKTAAKKMVAKKSSPPTIAQLLAVKFSRWQPASLYKVAAKSPEKFEAPPIITVDDPAEQQRLKALLKAKFDYDEIKAAAVEPPDPEPPKPAGPPPSRSELLAMQFPKWQPASLYQVAAESPGEFEAPPIITADDPAEQQRLKGLLKAKFDYDEIKAVAVEPPDPTPPAATPEAPASETPISEAPKEEPTPMETTPEPQAAQEEAPVEVTYADADVESSEGAGTRRMLMAAAAGVALLFLLIIMGSASNAGKYYLKPAANGLEIWRGSFAPLGTEKLLALPLVPPKQIKAAYTKKEALGLAFQYYMAQANQLAAQKGLPDFAAINDALAQAEKYAVGSQMKSRVHKQQGGLQATLLMFKADVAGSKSTPKDLQQAVDFLDEAAFKSKDEGQKALIKVKKERVAKKMAALEAQAAKAKARAAKAKAAKEARAKAAAAKAEKAAAAKAKKAPAKDAKPHA